MAARFPRRRWLLIGAMMAPFAMLAVFAVPQTASAVQVGWVFVTFSFYMATFSSFSVPYLAQFAEMSPDPDERTELMAWKHGFTGIGVLLSSAAAPAFVGQMGGDRAAYLTTAGLVGLLCMVFLLTAWRFARRIPERGGGGSPLGLRDLPAAFGDRKFALLCLSAIVMTVAAGTSYASFAFFVRFAMQRADAFAQIGVMSAIMAFAVMGGSPLWVWVSARLGKKNTYVLAACGHGLTTLVWGQLTGAPIWVAYVLSA